MIYITELFFIVSIIRINIKEIIAKTLINDNPVLNDKIHILLISNEYLQIFNFLYLLFLLSIE